MKKISFFVLLLILAGCSAEPKTDLRLQLNAQADDDAVQMKDEIRTLVRLSAAERTLENRFRVLQSSLADAEGNVLHLSIFPKLDNEHVRRLKRILDALEVVDPHQSYHPINGLTIELSSTKAEEELESYPLELDYGSGNWYLQIVDRPGPDTYGLSPKIVYPYFTYSLRSYLPDTARRLAVVDERGQEVMGVQSDAANVIASMLSSLPPSAPPFRVRLNEKTLESWDDLQENYPAFIADNKLYFKLERMNFNYGFSSYSYKDTKKVLDSNLETLLGAPVVLQVVVAPLLSSTLKSYDLELSEE